MLTDERLAALVRRIEEGSLTKADVLELVRAYRAARELARAARVTVMEGEG